jgi:hypothetical protein
MSSKNEVVKFYVLRLVDWLPNAVRNIQTNYDGAREEGHTNYYIIKPYIQQKNVFDFNPNVEKQHLAF